MQRHKKADGNCGFSPQSPLLHHGFVCFKETKSKFLQHTWLKTASRTDEMTLWEKAPATKPGYPSSILGTHVENGEMELSRHAMA